MDGFTSDLLMIFGPLALVAAATTAWAFMLNRKAQQRDEDSAKAMRDGLVEVRKKLGLPGA